MTPALYVALGLLAALALVPLWGLVVWLWYRFPPDADEVHYVTTDDGERLALHRYRPLPGAPARRHPAIVCHGLGVNRHCMAFPAGPSVAHVVRGLGFDTWVLELRVAGWSRPRSLARSPWRFDHFVEHDLPAAVAHVRRAHGGRPVHWVGHSMGGMVAYGHAGGRGADAGDLASLVAIASPGTFAGHGRFRLGAFLARLLFFVPGVYLRLPALLAAPLFGRPLLWLLRFVPFGQAIANTANMDPLVTRRFLANAVADIPRPLMGQFAGWVRRGSFDGRRTPEGRRDFRDHLTRVRAPALFVAGSRDELAPPRAVRAAFEAVSSPEKRFVLFARSEGHAVDYGHGDLILGTTCEREVFPEVAAWLERHDVDRHDAAAPAPTRVADGATAPAPAPQPATAGATG